MHLLEDTSTQSSSAMISKVILHHILTVYSQEILTLL